MTINKQSMLTTVLAVAVAVLVVDRAIEPAQAQGYSEVPNGVLNVKMDTVMIQLDGLQSTLKYVRDDLESIEKDLSLHSTMTELMCDG